MTDATDLLLAGGAAALGFLAFRGVAPPQGPALSPSESAGTLPDMNTTPVEVNQPGGLGSLPAAPRTMTAGGIRTVVVESIDNQYHQDSALWESMRTRVAKNVGWIEQFSPQLIDTDLEPHYVVAPWTRAEIKGFLDATEEPIDSNVHVRVLDLLSRAGMFDSVGGLTILLDGYHGWAWSWPFGPYVDNSLPPVHLVGDTFFDTWINADTLAGLDVDTRLLDDSIAGGFLPSRAGSADAFDGVFIQEVFHTIGGPWLPHEPPGTPMYNWWDFPSGMSMTQEQIDSMLQAPEPYNYVLP